MKPVFDFIEKETKEGEKTDEWYYKLYLILLEECKLN
jgi:hypothetical protein